MTSDPVKIAPASAAQLTVGRINAGMESHLMPMIGQILQIIRDISGRPDRMSVADLEEFINGEPTIMGRIVAIASSPGYNSGGIEISSVHHAISLIGFDRVRTLAISILLLESAQSEYSSAMNRELAGTALISGLATSEICRRGVFSDPELGFICGALRNYGQILAATFLPKEYAETVKPGARRRTDDAFQAVFSLTALELGRQIMAKMMLPKPILNTMTKLSPEERRNCSATSSSALVGAADFGLRFAELLQAADLDHQNFERRAEALSREYDVDFHLSTHEVRELLNYLLAMLGSIRCSAGSYVGTVAMFRRLECLAGKRDLPPALVVIAEPVAPGRKPAPTPPGADNYEI